MKVILLKDVPKIGKKDEIKDVSDGFAQNALLPKKLARIATPEAIKTLQDQRNREESAKTAGIEKMKAQIDMLQGHNIVVELAANDQGHLFSKFKVEQLRKILSQKGIDFDIKYIVPFEFKETGTHTIKIKSPQLNGDFTIDIKGI